jgi:glycosyltransferase involved in cell wall biosynthesis
MRSPEPFLKGLKLLASEIDISEIKVKLVGNMKGFENLIGKYGLENIVEMTGILPREEAHRHLLSADVLLLIDAPSETPSVFLPSKLVEYIFMNKPILAITPEGTSADVIQATHTGASVSPNDIIGIKNLIKNYYELFRTSKLEISPDAKEVNRYTARQCTKEMHELIGELIN